MISVIAKMGQTSLQPQPVKMGDFIVQKNKFLQALYSTQFVVNIIRTAVMDQTSWLEYAKTSAMKSMKTIYQQESKTLKPGNQG